MISKARVALVQGAAGGTGLALTRELLARPSLDCVIALTRTPDRPGLRALAAGDERLVLQSMDVEQPESVAAASAELANRVSGIDLLINCAGILHDSATGLAPERRLAEVNDMNLVRAFSVNAVGALLVAQQFEPLLRRGTAPLFAAISARVGSIADNRTGGWYAYRMSKAALNMGLKNLAIEWGRGRPPVRVIALQPGTVATPLSAPFTQGAAQGRKLFSPELAARQLLAVLEALPMDATGQFLDWQGNTVPW